MRKVLIVGDLHISDKVTGRHVNYFQNCLNVIEMITNAIVENKITDLYLLGDIVGTTEKNMRSRDALHTLMKTFLTWNKLTNGRVYTLRGNHDIGARTTDFDILVSLGFIKLVDYLDIEDKVRIHSLNYGEEKRTLSISENHWNMAVAHCNFQVEGQTTWFRAGEGLELSEMDNLEGIELVIAGHIHNPSQRMVTTAIRNKTISLYYPGCPTRPSRDPNIWDSCFGIVISVDDANSIDGVVGSGVGVDQIIFNLTPATELFTSTYDDLPEEEEEDLFSNVVNIEELSSILEELQQYNIGANKDYRSQIKRVAGLDKEAANLALEYIEKVEGEFANG